MEAEPKMTELVEITHEDFKTATMKIFKDLTEKNEHNERNGRHKKRTTKKELLDIKNTFLKWKIHWVALIAYMLTGEKQGTLKAWNRKYSSWKIEKDTEQSFSELWHNVKEFNVPVTGVQEDDNGVEEIMEKQW